MKAYSYIAYTDAGRRRQGSVIAETEADATRQLAGQGLHVSELTQKARRQGLSLRRKPRLNGELQAVLTRQMAVLLTADLPVEAALEAVRQGGGRLETVAARARATLLEGAALSDALEGTGAGFPPYYLASVRAGERSGDLAGVFSELAEFLENQGQDRAKIATALIYPGFVAAVSFVVCAILMVNVAPEIVAMFELSDRPLPQLTQIVMGVSDWIQGHILWLVAIAVALIAVMIAAAVVSPLRRARDRILLRLPMVGRFMRLGEAVQYLRTLALVLASRHPVIGAAENAAAVLHIDQFKAEGQAVTEAIQHGESLSQALTRLSIIPPVARQLITAGEASARLARMTERSAVLVENSLTTERKRIAALLEPMLMMLVGGFVLVIVLAVLLPIFDLQAVVAG